MEEQKDVRSYNVGGSDYAKHKYQVWDIVRMYGLNFFEGNMIKYLLRRKEGNDRMMDLRKIEHYLEYYSQIDCVRTDFSAGKFVEIDEALKDYDINRLERKLAEKIVQIGEYEEDEYRDRLIDDAKYIVQSLILIESL